MGHRQDDLVKSFLRPSENSRITLDVEEAQDADSYSGNPSEANTEALQRSHRLLSIVTHEVFKLDKSNSQLQIKTTFPITGDVTLAVAQARQQSSQNLHSSASSTPTAFVLTIKSNPKDASSQAYITGDVQKLRTFSAEYRRLKAIAVGAIDLRTRIIPLHERLSKASAGLPGNDLLDISTVCDEWIRKTATAKATVGYKSLRLRLGSFNVNGRIASQDLSPWLWGVAATKSTGQPWISPLEPLSPLDLSCNSPSEDEDDLLTKPPASGTLGMKGDDPDIFVLGFQELDLSTEALLYATSSTKEDMWMTAVFAGLGEKGILYEKVTFPGAKALSVTERASQLVSTQLVGMLLVVVVKKVLRPCFSDVRLCYAGAGIMGFMGNKGATAVRLEFTPTPSGESPATSTQPIALTFVNAHLAAFDEMVERRNYDFHDLSARLMFPSTGGAGYDAPFNLYQCDALFWMGDLNYRIDLSDSDIRAILTSHPDSDSGVQYMIAYDQLRNAIRSNEAFSGFVEYPITHLPTYRYAVGMSRDPLGYDTKRKPAWTDRIMYMPSPDIDLKQLGYRSHPEITLSDHRPISADFHIPAAIVIKGTYEEHSCQLRRELSGYEEPGKKPRIKVQTTNLDFGPIFGTTVAPLRSESHPRFAAPDIPVCFYQAPPWLHIEPLVGLLQPKETAAITIVAYVDDVTASKLNLRPPRLGCTLILHTALGKDHFISVSGHYQYTCFANTLERLVHLPGPIRELKTPEDLMPSTQALNAPERDYETY
ncbi:DNase I-like protein [Pisolithus marmoratus]|nr:DNase I-like protein [Pisolithus marmoratus]